MPTERLLRMVESNDTSTHLAASASGVARAITRSMMGLPYLVSPVWKYGVSMPGFDEVALGVDPEQPGRLADELAADDERGVEASLGFAQVLAVAPFDVAHGVGDEHRDVEHRAGAPQVGGQLACSAASTR